MFGVDTNGIFVSPTSCLGSMTDAPEQLHDGGISAVDVMELNFAGIIFGFRYVSACAAKVVLHGVELSMEQVFKWSEALYGAGVNMY